MRNKFTLILLLCLTFILIISALSGSVLGYFNAWFTSST